MSSNRLSTALSIWVTGAPVTEASREHGSFADMIRATVGGAWNGPWRVVDCTDESAVLPVPDETAGAIVTGSPARIAEQRPWMRHSQDALRGFVERGVPVLGICFGHQMLAVALGGRSGPNPRGREIGTVRVRQHGSDALLGDAPRRYNASMTHQDTILELPAGAQALAETALDRYAAVRFAEAAWGVQFHPEMDAAIVRAYVTALRGALRAEGIDPDARLAGAGDTPESAELLRAFARRVAARGARQAV